MSLCLSASGSEHCKMYIIVESLGCTLDTNIILYVDSASIKNKKNKNKKIFSPPSFPPPSPSLEYQKSSQRVSAFTKIHKRRHCVGEYFYVSTNLGDCSVSVRSTLPHFILQLRRVPLCACTCIYKSPADGPSGCFQSFAIATRAVGSTLLQSCCPGRRLQVSSQKWNPWVQGSVQWKYT